MNQDLAQQILREVKEVGVREICLCPGGRNNSLVKLLSGPPIFRCYTHFEERSCAFFALGRSLITERPVAVITTSGTAAGELLPAAMEAYYTGVPLLLITADRPKRFRGSGAPQAAEQVGLFGIYTPFKVDIDAIENINLSEWKFSAPAHINVCFEE